MYNILLPTDEIRSQLIDELKEKGVIAYICYVPLHHLLMDFRWAISGRLSCD